MNTNTLIKKILSGFILLLICAAPELLAQPCTWTDNQLINFPPIKLKPGYSTDLLATGRGTISVSCSQPIRSAVITLSDAGGSAFYANGDRAFVVFGSDAPGTAYRRLTLRNINTNLNNTQYAKMTNMPERDVRNFSASGQDLANTFFFPVFSADIDIPVFQDGTWSGQQTSGTFGGAYPYYGNNQANLIFKVNLKVTMGGVAGQPATQWSDTRLYGASLTTWEADKSCTITQSNLNVPMGQISTETVAQNQAPQTPFSINLNCPRGTRALVTVQDNNNFGNRSNQLTLDRNAVAKGVAIQLAQENGQALYLGQPITFSAINDGEFRLPFSARYVATSSITPGSANATATFTLAYQ